MLGVKSNDLCRNADMRKR